MNIVMIGTGNAATVLGRKLVSAGHTIRQVYGRNSSQASALAYEWDTESINYTSLITKEADIYIIAVADNAIAAIAADLKVPGKVVVHTAAAVPMDVLENVSANYGVIYPLQSMRKEQPAIPELTIYTEASNSKTAKVLNELAASVSSGAVREAGIDKRSRLHVAAVFANNFTNYLLTLAESFCKNEGIAFNELMPLIRNTVDRLAGESPANMQTGPAVRDDLDTLERHKQLLNNYPEHLAVYQFLSDAIKSHK